MADSKDDARSVEVAEIAAIMKTEAGRNVILRIIESTGYFGDTFEEDPIRHAYNAGRRRVGINIAQQMQEAAPGEFNIMLKEHFNNE